MIYDYDTSYLKLIVEGHILWRHAKQRCHAFSQDLKIPRDVATPALAHKRKDALVRVPRTQPTSIRQS